MIDSNNIHDLFPMKKKKKNDYLVQNYRKAGKRNFSNLESVNGILFIL